MRNIFFTLFLIISNDIFAASGGEFALENRYYPKEVASASEDYNLSVFGRFYYDYEKESLFLKASGIGRFDILDEKRRFATVEDLFIEKKVGENIRLSLGYKVYNDSVLEIFHPADIINSRNFDGDFERLEKRGELALETEVYNLDSSLSFYFFPHMERPLFPGAKSRMGVGREFDRVVAVIRDDIKESDFWIPQYGVRAKTKLLGFDIGAFYFRHIDRNRPVFAFNEFVSSPFLLPKNQKKFYPHFFEVDDFGFTLVGEISSILFKMESTYHHYVSERELLIVDKNKFSLFSPDDHLELATGLEYILSLESGHDMTFFLEWQKIFIQKNSYQKKSSPFQNDLSLGARYALNDIAGTEIYAFILGDVAGRDEGIFSVKLSRRFSERIRYEVAARVVWAHENDDYGLRALEDDHYLTMNVRYFY